MTTGRPLRLLPAPPTDPPYDDELAATARIVDGSLALAFPSPPASAVPLRLAPPALEEEMADRATPRALLPAPGPLAQRLAQAVVEIIAGDRPAAQLARHATLDVLDLLERSVRRWPRAFDVPAAPTARAARAAAPVPSARPRVTSVHLSEPADGVVEACAVVCAGPRRRALAFRLEGLDGRWQCTALRMG